MKSSITHAHAVKLAERLLEINRMELCVSFWESRKVMGLAAIFFSGFNLQCEWRADFYRCKLRLLTGRNKVVSMVKNNE